MLRRVINFKNFNDEDSSGVYYFNLTEQELLEMSVNKGGAFQEMLRRIVDTSDKEALLEEFKRIILTSYGVKSDDGNRFVKNDEVRLEFTQTAAYPALFIELATNNEKAIEFIAGIMPEKFRNEILRLDRDPNAVLNQRVDAAMAAVVPNTAPQTPGTPIIPTTAVPEDQGYVLPPAPGTPPASQSF